MADNNVYIIVIVLTCVIIIIGVVTGWAPGGIKITQQAILRVTPFTD